MEGMWMMSLSVIYGIFLELEISDRVDDHDRFPVKPRIRGHGCLCLGVNGCLSNPAEKISRFRPQEHRPVRGPWWLIVRCSSFLELIHSLQCASRDGAWGSSLYLENWIEGGREEERVLES